MSVADIDSNLFERFTEIEGGGERIGRGEKDLPLDQIGSVRAVIGQRRGHAEYLGDLPGEENAGQQHADKYADGEVMGEYDTGDGGEHHHRR